MSGSEWAWIIAASFWGVLVVALSIVLFNVFRLLSTVSDLVRGITDQTVPLLGGLNETISGVNTELARVDAIVASVQSITDTADQLAKVLHAAVSNPLVKAAAFAVGARRAARKLRSEA